MPGSNAFPLLRCLLRVGVGDVPQLRASRQDRVRGLEVSGSGDGRREERARGRRAE